MKQSKPITLAAFLLLLTLLAAVLPAPLAVLAAPSAIIYVHGDITDSRTWTPDNLYILDGDLYVAPSGVLTIQAGVQVKVQYSFALNVDGQLILQGTAQNPVVFTSNRDNSFGGDTDPGSTPPAPGDWKGITLLYLSGPGSPNFQNARVRYASTGLYFQNQTGSPLDKPITGSTFDYNQTGVNLDSAVGDITSLVQNNKFQNNDLGMEIQSNTLGNSFPTLQGNLFDHNTGFPLLLRGGSFPNAYLDNTFNANGRQGIAVADTIDIGGAWPKVAVSPTPGAVILPYVVEDYVEVAQGVTLQLPAGLVVKAGGYAIFEVYGRLELLGSATERVVFTSIHDDNYGGNTDGALIDPASDPWYGLELFYQGGLSTSSFQHAVVSYAVSGLMVTNQAAGVYSPTIGSSTFKYNGFGVNLLVGAAGDIQSTIQNNTFENNEYGLVAAAPTNGIATGSALPVLQTNTFTGSTVYPIGLQGSALPTYSGNTFSANLNPAIAVQGEIHRSGAWPGVPGADGRLLPYVLTDKFTIGAANKLSLPAGTVVKSGGPAFVVDGALDLGSTPAAAVVFTSLNDDQYGGNTSFATPHAPAMQPAAAYPVETPGRVALGDAGFIPLDRSVQLAAQPAAAGDWAGLEIRSAAALHELNLRYAAAGLRLVNQGSTPFSVTVTGSIIDFCQVGVSLQAANSGGDLSAQISSSQILRSGAGVRVLFQPGYLGVSTAVLHQNNLMLNGIAVDNQQTALIVNAENNWWGDASGPYHATNLAGRGNPVSDFVDFKPFQAQPPVPPLIQAGMFLPIVRR